MAEKQIGSETFISQVVDELLLSPEKMADKVVVLPSRRAMVFVKNEMLSRDYKSAWLPVFYTMDEFIQTLYPGVVTDHLALVFELFEVVVKLTPSNPPEFDRFFTWANQTLNDFSLVDSNLIEPRDFYKNLSAIISIENWSFSEENLSNNQKEFNHFWVDQLRIYQTFKKNLEGKNMAYASMAVRFVAERIESLLGSDTKTYIFAGFNALTRAEQLIIEQISQRDQLVYLMDIDSFFVEGHREAGLFYRNLVKKYQWEGLSKIADGFRDQPKKIRVLNVSQNSGIALTASQLLNSEKFPERCAVVLADESLLENVLENLPQSVDAVNITMGLPLINSPLQDFISAFLEVQEKVNSSGRIYYKTLLRFVNHSFLNRPDFRKDLQYIRLQIKKNNIAQCQTSDFTTGLSPTFNTLLDRLFMPWKQLPEDATVAATAISAILLDQTENTTTKAYLIKFNQLINKANHHLTTYRIKTTLKSYGFVLKELIKKEKINYQGEPLEGLQILGLLETRMLDYETVYLLSANEGILPKTRSQFSFIPWELRVYFDLPGRKEQDALYAYYFYRLIQRAKNITLIYNSDESEFSRPSEPSRYIRQLSYYTKKHHLPFDIKMREVIPDFTLSDEDIFPPVKRDQNYADQVKEKLEKGVSPTALSTWLNCPLDFYLRYIVGLSELREIKEEIGHDLFGTIIHQTLELLYTPYINQALTPKILDGLISGREAAILTAVEDVLPGAMDKSGYNRLRIRLIDELIKRFLLRDKQDVEETLKKSKTLLILGLEKKVSRTLPLETTFGTVKLKVSGIIDRIDRKGEIVRIIDYKTGVTERLSGVHIPDIFDGKKNTKALQLLLYQMAYDGFENPLVKPSILFFKEIDKFFQVLSLTTPAPEVPDLFISHLTQLIEKMMDPDGTFLKHNPESKWCKFCTLS